MTKNAERYLKWVISISQLHHTEQRVAYFLAKFYSISGSIPNFLQWHYIYCFQRTKLIRWIVFSFNQFQKFIHFFPFFFADKKHSEWLCHLFRHRDLYLRWCNTRCWYSQTYSSGQNKGTKTKKDTHNISDWGNNPVGKLSSQTDHMDLKKHTRPNAIIVF